MEPHPTPSKRRLATLTRHLTTATAYDDTYDTHTYKTTWSHVLPMGNPNKSLKYPPAEWVLRCKLAAAYRVAHHFHWDQIIFNHITAKVPDSEQEDDGPHFLINPLGLRFEEVTASSLLKVTVDGAIKDRGTNAGGLFRQGFVIHAAIHAVRHDAVCVWHCHHEDTAAVCMTKFGLMPLSQEAIGMLPTIAYHPFEGTANDMGEQQRLQRNIGSTKKILMLDNHGPLTLGKSIDEAFYLMYNVCRAASYQQKALAAVGGDVEKLYVPDQAALAAMIARGKRGNLTHQEEYKDGAGVKASPELVFRAMCRLVEEQYGVENIYDVQNVER